MFQMSEQMLTPIPPHCQVKFSRSGETLTKPSEAGESCFRYSQGHYRAGDAGRMGKMNVEESP